MLVKKKKSDFSVSLKQQLGASHCLYLILKCFTVITVRHIGIHVLINVLHNIWCLFLITSSVNKLYK